MKHLLAKIKELQAREFDVVTSRGSLAIHQTQRNKAKAELIDALYQDLNEVFEQEGYQVFQTSSGPILEISNAHVEDQIMNNEDGDNYSGFLSIQFDAIMKNLDTDGSIEQEDYLRDQEAKKEKEEIKEKAKMKKIEKDAEMRAEKARRREEEIARLQALREKESDGK